MGRWSIVRDESAHVETDGSDTWESLRLPTCLGHVRVRLRGRGQAMMFWPSLLMDGAMWSAAARHFENRYRIVLVDSPGHGESDPLARMFTFDECARCIVQLLDALQVPKVIFVGNSWGGMIGGTFAAHYPARIEAAILMNATASAAGRRQKFEFLALTSIVRALGTIRGPLVGRVTRAFLGPTTLRERPEVARTIHEALGRVRVASAIFAVNSVVSARPDQHALLETIRAPVLVASGEEDPTFPLPETQRMAAAIPGAEFHVMRGTGHLAGLERPEEVSALIHDFLQRRSVPSNSH